jgi:transcriptional regulator with XRE-family HTH domain
MDSDEAARGETGQPRLHDLADRLEKLITALYPDERKRPGYARLATMIRESTGGRISATYLWELTTGRKRNVTLAQLGVLADFFGVPLEYFINDEVSRRVNAQLGLAVALRDTKVRNLALRAEGLSPGSLDALLAIVNEARRVENLDQVREEEPDAGTPPTHRGTHRL